ncbi:MAG: GAF domain-containing protein [Chloroflexi bacterium]|nr:GAF domain-containing protein [Chloroflexota bacterium]
MNSQMNQTNSSNFIAANREVVDATVARNAYNLSVMLLVASIPSIGIFVFYGLQNNAWQILSAAAIMFIASFGAVLALYLVPRDRSNLAMMIIITSFTITFISIPFFIQGLGIVLALTLFILTVAITGLAMPSRFAPSGLVVGLASAVLVLLLDYVILPDGRLRVPGLEKTTPFIVVGFAVFFIIYTFRQFNRLSLRIKITLSILITGGLVVSSITVFGLNRANTTVGLITDRYEAASNENINLNISGAVQAEVSKTDEFFSAVLKDLTILADNRASLEAQKATLSLGTYWDSHTRLFQLPTGQYGNSPTDVASIFMPSTMQISEDILVDLNTTAYLDFYAPNFLKSHPDVVAVYYISKNGATTYYPNINLAQNVPADFDATKQNFYTIATPENDPQREPRWTDAYQDPAGNGLITTLSIPVYVRDNFIGVMGLDLQLEKLSQAIANIRLGDTGYAFLVDQAGHILAMPAQGYLLYGIQPEEVPMNQSPKLSILAKGPYDLQDVTAKIINGQTGVSTINIKNVSNFIAYAPLPTPNYRLAVIAPEAEFTEEFKTTKAEITRTEEAAIEGLAVILFALLIMAILISLWVGQIITGPLIRLTRTAESITQGDFGARAKVETFDETGTLAYSFNSMAERLNDTLAGLEKRVFDRTQELQKANEGINRRAAQFESIASVARTISSTQTLDELLPQIAQTISDQFGFYHVGIFLLDTNREYAILTASNSEGGKIMLARNHRLRVGGTGIVGMVTNTGQPRIALDVGLDAAFFNNPDLPGTHSEVALPLRVGSEIIGALDVQSSETNAFTDEDVKILSTLADQVGIAIQNARSYQQSREALALADAASIQLSEQQWKNFFESQPGSGFVYDGIDAKSLKPTEGIDHNSLAIPLILRGTRIGTLKLSAAEPGRTWTEDEIAMAQATAERTALAVEGARLLQEAQRRAAKERTIGEISAKIGGLITIENILQTAIQELGNTMPHTDIAIQFKKDQETE